MSPKSGFVALVGVALVASPIVPPALAQKGVTPNSTPEPVILVAKPGNTPTTSTKQDALLDRVVNEDNNGEVPISPQELRAASKNHGQRALKQGLRQVGSKEQPPGSNCNEFSPYFGKGCQPWCADFVSWTFDSTGNRNKRVDWGNPSAVASIHRWAKKTNNVVKTPKPGDIFLIRKNGVSHTGLVRSVGRRTFTTVEGNASNKVRSVKRSLSKGYVFVRVPSRQ